MQRGTDWLDGWTVLSSEGRHMAHTNPAMYGYLCMLYSMPSMYR